MDLLYYTLGGYVAVGLAFAIRQSQKFVKEQKAVTGSQVAFFFMVWLVFWLPVAVVLTLTYLFDQFGEWLKKTVR